MLLRNRNKIAAMKSLPQKPFYSSIAIIILLPPLIVFLHIFVMIIFGMKTIDENNIDKVSHFLEAISIGISAAGVLWHLIRRKIIELQNINVFRILVFGFVCFAVIGWEIFEYIFLIEFLPEYFTHSGTIIDMICGLIGGLLAMFIIRRPFG